MERIAYRFACNLFMTSHVDDVYLAVLQYKRKYLTSNPEFVESINMSEEQLQLFIAAEEELAKQGFNPQQSRKMILKCSEVNYFGVLFRMGDRVFDVYHQTFIDFNKLMVVKYNKLSEYYTDDQYKPVQIKAGECPFFDKEGVSIYLTDWKSFREYEHSIEKIHGNHDITGSFKNEIGIVGAQRKRKQ